MLQYFEETQFPFTPKFRGQDEKGRSKLTFIPGETPDTENLGLSQLKACAKLLRDFHDLAALSPLCGDSETICHHDFAPWNIVFYEGRLVGIIDFDEAKPGERIIDLAYFLWTFLELGAPNKNDAAQIQKIVLLSQAYGLKDGQKLVPAILKEQARILVFRKDKALHDPVESERTFSAGALKRIQHEVAWITTHQTSINLALQAAGVWV